MTISKNVAGITLALAMSAAVAGAAIIDNTHDLASGGRNQTYADFTNNNEAAGVKIDDLRVWCAGTGPRDVTVYWKTGTANGFFTNASAWTSIGTVSVSTSGSFVSLVGLGLSLPTINVAQGNTVAFSFFTPVSPNSNAIAYTLNATPISDSTATLTFGVSIATTTTPFSGSTFGTWGSGTGSRSGKVGVEYSVIPEPATVGLLSFGGAAWLIRRRRLRKGA